MSSRVIIHKNEKVSYPFFALHVWKNILRILFMCFFQFCFIFLINMYLYNKEKEVKQHMHSATILAPSLSFV